MASISPDIFVEGRKFSLICEFIVMPRHDHESEFYLRTELKKNTDP
jgi:hypothetical protein